MLATVSERDWQAWQPDREAARILASQEDSIRVAAIYAQLAAAKAVNRLAAAVEQASKPRTASSPAAVGTWAT